MLRRDSILIVNDEPTNFGYVGGFDERALRLNRARGLAQWFSDQTFHETDTIAEAWSQCCDTQVFLRCTDADTADRAAACLRQFLDEYKIHSTRERQVVDGYEMWERKKGLFWHRKTVQVGMLAQHRTIFDANYQSLHEQLVLLSRRIQSFAVGERVIKRGRIISFEQVPAPAPITSQVYAWIHSYSANSPFHVSGKSFELDVLLARKGTGGRSLGESNTRKPPKDLSNLGRTPQRKPAGGSSNGRLRNGN